VPSSQSPARPAWERHGSHENATRAGHASCTLPRVLAALKRQLVRCGVRVALAAALAVMFALVPLRVAAEAPAPEASPACGASGASSVCGLEELAEAGTSLAAADASAPVTLLFFWGVGCPHCEEARPLVDALAKENPRLRVEAVEVRGDPEGRRRFIDTMTRLGATAVGVPTFVVGAAYVVGYTKGESDEQVRALVAGALPSRGADASDPSTSAPAPSTFSVPWVGEIDPSSVSLPGLTLAMGLADGVNPCAIWVLVVLLGILLHVETTRRMVLYAGTFVVMSGVVYFVFMAAWATVFELVGLSRLVTRGLGAALLGMGALNLKDLVWFKKGPSLVIPDKVKPGLFRRMRAIASAATMPAALGGIAVLAFVVNLVELGCTLGLPAIYTRILSLRGLGAAPRFAYLALYNVAYVVPLLVVVAVFIGLKRRVTVTKAIARTLKGISGLLLVTFGVLFLVAPHVLAAM
jgi:thiol-disulfide isomerase/thioredoxin